MSRVKRELAGFAGAFVGIQGVRALVTIADRYSNMAGQIRLATRSQVEFARAEAEVFAISQRTSTSLASTTELYTRLTRSTGEYGVSQGRVLRLAETINQTFAVSGTAASAQANAITQLTQAFAGGVLRAEEFNSIIESGPRLAQALAEGLGVGIGELRRMVNDGTVDVGRMIAALEDQADKIETEFGQMPLTIERGWTQITNAISSYVGRADQANGTSRDIAEALAWVARNIDTLIEGAVTLAKVLLTIYSAKLLTQAALYTAELARQVALQLAAASAARDMGIKTSNGIAASIKSIGLLRIAIGGVAAGLVGWQIGTYLREQFRIVADAGDYLVYGIAQGWEKLKRASAVAWEAIKFTAIGAIDLILESIAGMLRGLASAADVEVMGNKLFGGTADGLGAIADSISGVLTPLDDYKGALTEISNEYDKNSAANAVMLADMQSATSATFAAKEATAALNEGLGKTPPAATGAGEGLSELSKANADYVKSLQDEVATYGLVGAALERYRAAHQGLSPEGLSAAMAAIAQKEALDALATESNEAATALESLRTMQSSLDDETADMSAKLGGASAAQIEFNRTQREAAKAYAIAAKSMDPRALDAYIKAMEKARKKLDMSNEAESLAVIEELMTKITEKNLADKNPIFTMIDQIGTLQEALEKVSDPMSEAFDPEKVEAFTKAIDAANSALHVEMAGSFKALLGAVQTFTKEGSSSFDAIEKGMAALSLVQDILALKAAVTAVLTQGEGEPYSAFARMAAMAAAVAPILASIGQTIASFSGGGFSDTAAERQATQGTGTVLGDAEAKSESIENAVEMTADATNELVGINRGMLRALLSLQAGLSAAGGLLARGAGEADFSGMNLSEEGDRSIGEQFDIIGRLIGGATEITDQGIIIMGGALNDMLENIAIGAYQEVQSRSWAFGSTHTNEGVIDITDQFGQQFQLVIGSIIDTVREGALALGLLPADIEAAIAAYQVEEIRISLKDLSAEEQQAELEAVFSSIFDGLAGAVVPFIEQFQQVGEGLGETLVRIATEVQVVQEAMRYLGLAINETDPERFAQISDALIQASGGIEAFIAGMRSFADNFGPESHKFQVASTELASAFEQVGLTVPETRDGMWELMQSLDATTEEGREQIATLLRLSDVAGQYYDMLDEQVTEAAKYLESIGMATGSLSAFGRELVEIRQSGDKAVDAANLLAISQGREGASAVQLARIHDWTAKQIAAALRRLAQETRDIISQLYGGQAGTLEGINEQIAELEGAMGGVADSIGSVTDAGNDLFEQWRAGIQSLSEYLDSSLFGDLSPLTPEAQLTEAQSQLDAAIAAAAGGDAEALADIPRLMDLYAGLLRDSEASGGDYNAQIMNYRAMLRDLLAMEGPADLSEAGSDQNPIQVAVSASPELQALYEARDALLAQQEAEHRAVLAQQLAQNLHDMAVLTRTPILEMIALQGVALTDLATDMGVNLDNLTAGSVLALGNMATTLGLSLTGLTTALGINLTDLAGGLTELTGRLGIDLTALTTESTRALADLATSLGGDLSDVATALGLDLGDLASAQSLLNQALADTIDDLPAGQRDLLKPLLEAISTATTEADANEAIKALEDQVNLLGGDTATALAPYLAGVFPPDAMDQLDYLGDLQDIGADQLDVLRDIARGLDVPGYAVGTGYVPQTGLAMIHQGEAIVPASVASWMRGAGFPVAGTANDGATAAEVRALRGEVIELRRALADRIDRNTEAVVDEGGKARAQRDDIAQRNENIQRSQRYG